MLSFLAIYSLGITAIVPLILIYGVKAKKSLKIARVENAALSDRYLEVVEDRITDWDVDFYLDRQGVTHKWRRVSRSHIEDVHDRVKYKDTLQTDLCDRCGLVRRTWVHGLGAISFSNLAGYFRGSQKIHGLFVSEQSLRCIPAPNVRVLASKPDQKLLGS